MIDCQYDQLSEAANPTARLASPGLEPVCHEANHWNADLTAVKWGREKGGGVDWAWSATVAAVRSISTIARSELQEQCDYQANQSSKARQAKLFGAHFYIFYLPPSPQLVLSSSKLVRLFEIFKSKLLNETANKQTHVAWQKFWQKISHSQCAKYWQSKWVKWANVRHIVCQLALAI